MTMTLFQRLEQRILDRYHGWLDKRIPPQRQITLVQDNIFIYPIWQFVYYFIVVMALWLAATNYENNLVFALAFLLLGIFLVCILHTYNNVAGLTVTVIGCEPVFAGQYADVELMLSTAEHKWRDNIMLYWDSAHPAQASLMGVQTLRVQVPVKTGRRGWFNPRRMTVSSVYPLGIIRSVSYLDLDIKVLVYPAPVCHGNFASSEQAPADGEGQVLQQGSTEFSHLREYEPGASLRQIAWKQYSKTGELFLKAYGDYAALNLWLDWHAYPGLGIEERLSTLCYWALEFDKRNETYGLLLPEQTIKPDQGSAHLQRVLTALALYGSVSDLKGQADRQNQESGE